MKLRWLALLAFGLLGLVASGFPAVGQDKKDVEKKPDGDKKKVTLKVQVPQDNATLTIDGVKTKQSGKTRTFTSPALDPKNTYSYKLQVMWEPNNYTKITRTFIVKVNPAKDSELKIDMTKPNPAIKDDIVVRYVPTPDAVVDAMCKLAKVDKNDVVYDLGCGDGRMVCRAIANFGAKRGVGIDIDPERVKDSKETAQKYKVEGKVEFRQGDVLKVDDIPDASVVLLYMGHDINKRLQPILKAKLKPGSRVVSHRFLMDDDWPPTKTERLNVDGEDYEIHLWIIGADKEKKGAK